MTSTSFQHLFRIDHQVEVRINVTNVCNLHCDFCDHDAHLPFNKGGQRIFRRKPMVTTPEALERLCEVLAGIGEDDRHVLQGGEITVLPIRMVVQIVDILSAYGRNIGMRTNGYNLSGIPLDSLNKLRFIYLNHHGNNQDAMDHCRRFLDDNYDGQVIHERSYQHRDLSNYLHHGRGTVEQALDCNHLLSTLTFMPPVVHPCCNSWALMNALNDGNMVNQLADAGWSSNNPDLGWALANWRETLPQHFLESYCASSCYMTVPDDGRPQYKIHPHPLDRTLKR